MKTFVKMAAQGDLLIRRVEKIPEGMKESMSVGGVHILAHSETGHNHVVMERPGVRVLNDPADAFRAFLCVTEDGGAVLEHLRSYDTHEALLIPPGNYELRRQRESSPEGWRRAQD